MAGNSDNKADLSVDNVHTSFGLTKLCPAEPHRPSNEPQPKNFDAESRSHVALVHLTHEEV